MRYVLTDGRLAELARAELTQLLGDNRAAGRAEVAASTLEQIAQLEAGSAKAARNASMAQNATEEESYKSVARELSEEAQHLKASVNELDAEIARAKSVEERLATHGATAPTPLDVFDQEAPVGKKEVIASLIERVVVDCEAATAEVVIRAIAA